MSDDARRAGPPDRPEQAAEPAGDSSRVHLLSSVAPPGAPPPAGSAPALRGRGHYRVQEEIARGGMGRILRARDTELGREVAIKVLDGALLDRPVAVRRFVEEAQIAGQLQHPGVVPVYEMGHMEDERPYFAMKLVKGSTFSEVLKRRGAPEEDLSANLRIFESICQTVAYAHSKGVIHRDLKPANVMVGSFGEVLVVDWGLAKVLAQGEEAFEEPLPERTLIETVRSGSGSSATDSIVGSVMGTPAYMPPEQARGEVASLDERADVFALGAILCQILTGKPPYEGSEEERTVVLAAQARLEPARARLEQASIPPALKQLCLQCLMPARVARPRDAGELAARMRAHFSGLAEEARSAQLAAAEARVREVGERRARRLTLWLSATVLVALVSVGGALWWAEAGRERRAAALARTIDDTRSQVLALHDAGRFDEALEAARSGLRVLEGDDTDPALVARAAEVQALALGRVEAEHERLERERKNALLVERLEELRYRQIEAVFYQSHADLDAGFEAAFEDYGLDLDVEQGDLLGALEVLRASGIASRIVAAIDDWAGVKRKVHGADSFASQVLTSLAMDLDPDGPSRATRQAILALDESALAELAEHAIERRLDPDALWTLAFALHDFKALREDAFRLLDRAVRAYPGEFVMQLALGAATREMNRQDIALRHLQAACALRPEAGYARVLLGSALYEIGDVPPAVEALREAVRLDPKSARIRYQLAMALSALGDDEGALAAYDAAFALTPGDRILELDREGARFQSGRMSRADFLALLDSNAAWSASELVPFGFALADHPDPAQRDPERALAIGEEITRVAPDAPEGWLIVARAALGLARHQAVLDGLERAASLVRVRSLSLEAEYDLLRARALQGLGKSAEARALLSQTEREIMDLVGLRREEWLRSNLFRHFREAQAELDAGPR